MAATPTDDNTLSRLKHLDIHGDDAGSQGAPRNKNMKRGQGATGGLKQFSLKVCAKVESKGRTTFNEVADELVAEFLDPANGGQPAGQLEYEEKTIRRRVYDALNVLVAMDIISKDNKELHWKGLPQTGSNLIHELKSEGVAIQNRSEKKSEYLQEIEVQYAALQNLIQRNQQLYTSANIPSRRIDLPFILVKTQLHVTIEVEMSDDWQFIQLDFNNTPFELQYDDYVLQEMKLCGRSKGDDDVANGGSMDGGAYARLADMFIR